MLQKQPDGVGGGTMDGVGDPGIAVDRAAGVVGGRDLGHTHDNREQQHEPGQHEKEGDAALAALMELSPRGHGTLHDRARVMPLVDRSVTQSVSSIGSYCTSKSVSSATSTREIVSPGFCATTSRTS